MLHICWRNSQDSRGVTVTVVRAESESEVRITLGIQQVSNKQKHKTIHFEILFCLKKIVKRVLFKNRIVIWHLGASGAVSGRAQLWPVPSGF